MLLILEREGEGKGGGRDRQTDRQTDIDLRGKHWSVASHTHLTRDRTCNFLVYGMTLPPTELHGQGMCYTYFTTIINIIKDPGFFFPVLFVIHRISLVFSWFFLPHPPSSDNRNCNWVMRPLEPYSRARWMILTCRSPGWCSQNSDVKNSWILTFKYTLVSA